MKTLMVSPGDLTADPYAWVVAQLEEAFGVGCVLRQQRDFGFSLAMGVTVGSGETRQRHAFIVKELRCLHVFDTSDSENPRASCEQYADQHEQYDLNVQPDREAILASKIDETREWFNMT